VVFVVALRVVAVSRDHAYRITTGLVMFGGGGLPLAATSYSIDSQPPWSSFLCFGLWAYRR
jgi:hypothetical protein